MIQQESRLKVQIIVEQKKYFVLEYWEVLKQDMLQLGDKIVGTVKACYAFWKC